MTGRLGGDFDGHAPYGGLRSPASSFATTDTYTEYSLLDPGKQSFRITYFVTELEEGSPYHINGVRAGSVESDLQVYDVRTCAKLAAELMTGDQLLADDPTNPMYQPKNEYIRVSLPKPVAAGAEARVRIDKTYADDRSYFIDEKTGHIVFKRLFGIGRNCVVLPMGYRLVASSVNAQIDFSADGRTKLMFLNWHGYSSDCIVHAAKLPPGSPPPPLPPACVGTEAALDNTEALFSITEPTDPVEFVVDFDVGAEASAPIAVLDALLSAGEVVLAGAVRAVDLDSGAELACSSSSNSGGSGWSTAALQPARVLPAAEIAVLKAEAAAYGSTIPLLPLGRARVSTSLTGLTSLGVGGELIFTAAITAARTTVLLPDGWYPTGASEAAQVGTMAGGQAFVLLIAAFQAKPTLQVRAVRAVQAGSKL